MSAALITTPHLAPVIGSPVLSLIGNTPLLRIRSLSTSNVGICAKAEFFNPGGSVKDRPALNMILDGERTGALDPGRIILDATSGNTGIAYAMIGAAQGYPREALPARATPRIERKRILKAYGAEIVFTDPGEGLRRRHPQVPRDLRRRIPTATSTPTSTTTRPTGRRISRPPASRSSSRPTAGSRTSSPAWAPAAPSWASTRRLKRRRPAASQCISAQPSSGFHGLEGMKHMPTAIVPGIYDPTLADDNLWIDTEDAYAMVRRLAREEGLLVGISSGAQRASRRASSAANWHAAASAA